jgi:large subunit ribosomal protein L13
VKTYSAKPGEVERRWYVVDAEGQVLGRLATRVATILRGKHKPQFTPHLDVGDFVVVVNAEKIKLTGKKLTDKWYRRHSGYPGGLSSLWYAKLLETHPDRAIRKAVWGMLPKTSLGRQQLRKLKVYAGVDHPHRAQKPEVLEIHTRGEELPDKQDMTAGAPQTAAPQTAATQPAKEE